MKNRKHRTLTDSERRARRRRLSRIAEELGFTGIVEYRHVHSQSGGAQYCQGSQADVLVVYAEAFDRDADPQDFSLEAILAHECGHQILARHPRISRRVAGKLTLASEEILASLLGAIISPCESDRDALIAKATVELMEHAVEPEDAIRQLQQLCELLETLS